MTDAPPPTRRDDLAPLTRRDDLAPPTRRDDLPPPTRRDDAPGARDLRLPQELDARFALIETLPATGAEADLFQVTDRTTSAPYVLKLFRQGIKVDPGLRDSLPRITADLPHCVTVFETGDAGGRDYEIQEYVREGSLAIGRPWPTARITALVRQLADTLRHLHEHGIVHRDLKPGNILLRETDPLNVAVCDFGISRLLEMTAEFTSVAGTFAYLPPEALAGPEVRLSPAWDWWALGMVVRSMATGRPPDDGISEPVFRTGIATAPVDLSGVTDPRVELLCRGLLTRSPNRRWTSEQVFDWLGGASPEVDDHAAPEPRRAGEQIPWSERTFADASACAAAVAADWDGALQHFCDREGVDWGAEFRRLVVRAHHDRLDAAGAVLAEPRTPPGLRLVRLLRMLDPEGPPAYRGYRLDGDRTTALARIAVDHGHPEHETAAVIVADLRNPTLMRELAAMPGGHRLRITAHNRDRFGDRWRTRARETLDAPDEWLLYLAADPSAATERLRTRLHSAAGPMRLPWFATLANSPDPLDRLEALLRIGDAEREAR